VRAFLRDYNAQQGATILLTSHYMADVTALARRVLVIDHGALRFDGDLAALVEAHSPHRLVRVTLREAAPAHTWASFGEVSAVDGAVVTLLVPRAETAAVAAVAGASVYFRYTGAVAGWTNAEVLVVIGLFFTLNGLRQMLLQPNLERMTDYVRLGTLDFLLIKPFDAQLLVSLRHLNANTLLDPVLGLALTTTGTVLAGRGTSVAALASFAWMTACAVLLMYALTTYPAAAFSAASTPPCCCSDLPRRRRRHPRHARLTALPPLLHRRERLTPIPGQVATVPGLPRGRRR